MECTLFKTRSRARINTITKEFIEKNKVIDKKYAIVPDNIKVLKNQITQAFPDENFSNRGFVNFLSKNGYISSNELVKSRLVNNLNEYDKVRALNPDLRFTPINNNINSVFQNSAASLQNFKTEFNTAMVEHVLINRNIGESGVGEYIDSSKVNQSLKNYINGLFRKVTSLSKYLDTSEMPDADKEAQYTLDLYGGDSYSIKSNGETPEAFYRSSLKNAYAGFIKKYFAPNTGLFKDIKDGSISPALFNYLSARIKDIPKAKEFFSDYNAFVILNNFDRCIKDFFPDILEIDPKQFGLLNIDSDKYRRTKAGNIVTYWREDNFRKDSASEHAPNMLKLLLGTIPYYNGNNQRDEFKTINIGRINDLADAINTAEANHIGKKIGGIFIEPFKNNPTKMLEVYVKNFDNPKFVKMNTGVFDVLYTLRHYIYADSQLSPIRDIEKSYGILNTNNSLISLFSEQIKNSVRKNIVQFKGNASETIKLGGYENSINTTKTRILNHWKSRFDSVQSQEFLKDAQKINAIQQPLEFKDAKVYLEKFTGFQKNQIDVLYKDDNDENNRSLTLVNKKLAEYIIEYSNVEKRSNFNLTGEGSGDVVEFLNNCVERLFKTRISSTYDTGTSQIATQGITSIIEHDKDNIYNHKLPSEISLFHDFPKLLGDTYIKNEKEKEKGSKSKDVADFNPVESFWSSFFGEFASRAIKHNSILVQPANFSDKSNISSKEFNINEIINKYIGDTKIEKLSTASNEDLLAFYHYYENNYYTSLIDKIKSDFEILGIINSGLTRDEAIKNINQELRKLSKKDIESKIREYNKINFSNPIEITEEVHFSSYVDNKGDGILALNQLLTHRYETSKSLTEFSKKHQVDQKNFLEKLIEINNKSAGATGVDDLFMSSNFKFGDNTLFGAIKQLVPGLDMEAYKKSWGQTGPTDKFVAFKLNGEIQLKLPKELKKTDEIELNPVLDRYLLYSNIMRSNYLKVNMKHPELDPGKKLKIGGDIQAEESVRTVAFYKRMSAVLSTIEPHFRKLLNGVSNTVKVATINDIEAHTYNYNGDKDKIKATDGSVKSSPLLAMLITNSHPGKEYEGTKKFTGISINHGSSAFFKCADFPISNKSALESSRSSASDYLLMKKMHDLPWINNDGFIDIDLMKSIKGTPISLKNLNFPKLYFRENGKYWMINDMKRVAYSKEVGSNYEVELQEVDPNGKPAMIPDTYNKVPTVTKNIPINSLFQLWEALGGRHSLELNKDEELEQSENSIVASVEFMNSFMVPKDRDNSLIYGFTPTIKRGETIDFDNIDPEKVHQPLKEFMIGYVANASAVKRGITNLNSNTLYHNNEDLIYSTVTMDNMGIQLDPNHSADGSQLREMTQVMSAAAGLGYTLDEVNDLYKSIELIIQDSCKKYIADVNDPNYYEKLTKSFVKSLFNKDRISQAQSVYENLIANTENDLKIPFSEPTYFSMFSADVIGKLSRDVIRRNYPGIPGILNPSYGTWQLFENEAGKTFLYSDLLDKVYNDLRVSPEQETDYHKQLKLAAGAKQSDDELINLHLAKYFAPKQITIEEIKPLDNISYTIKGPNGDSSGVSKMDSIEEYYRVKDLLRSQPLDYTVEVYKNFHVPRDLKPNEITFETNVNGIDIKSNLFDTDSIRTSFDIEKFSSLSEKKKQMISDYLKYSIKVDVNKLSTDPEILQNNVQEIISKLESGDKATSGEVKKIVGNWCQWTNNLLHEGFVPENIENFFDGEKYDFDSYFNGINFYNRYTIDQLRNPVKSNIKPITNYSLKEAEIIVPKLYRTQYGLSNKDSLSKIDEQGVAFFANKIASKYVDKNAVITVVNNNLPNLYIINSLNPNYRKIETNTITNDDGKTFAIDENGETLYLIPQDRKRLNGFYEDRNGDQFLYLNSLNDLDNILNSIKKNILFVTANEEELKDTLPVHNVLAKYNISSSAKNYYESEMKAINSSKNLGELVDNTVRSLYSNNETKKNIDLWINEVATAQYSSWKKSNLFISARIPSQDMQSFMSMKAVAYNEGTSANIYVSHWQLWLQGSDLDIDKAYTLGHEINPNGLYFGWSPLFSFENESAITDRESLPLPTGKQYRAEFKEVADPGDFNLTPYLHDTSLKSISKLLRDLDKLDDGSVLTVTETDHNGILNKVNEHNALTMNEIGVKNKVVSSLIKIINDPRNQIAAYSPISMDLFKSVTSQFESKNRVSLYDGVSNFFQQYQASVGKKVIGAVASSGTKAFFVLTNYFNNYYRGLSENMFSKESNKYFINKFVMKTPLLDEKGKPVFKKGEMQYIPKVYSISTLSDVRVTPEIMNKLQEALDEAVPVVQGEQKVSEKLFKGYSSASLTISELLSLATDNAKELQLAKLNCGLEFSGMYLYLIGLGVPPREVAYYMIDGPVKQVISMLETNSFTEKAPSLDVIMHGKDIDPQLFRIYQGGKEIQKLAQLLGINQGLSADVSEMQRYTSSFGNVILDQINGFYGKGVKNLEEKIAKSKTYLSEGYISNVLNRAHDYKLMYNPIDINKFITDIDYRNAAIDMYNLVKCSYNILDVIMDVSHYRGMLKALNDTNNLIMAVSSKYRFINNEAFDIYKSYKNKFENVPSYTELIPKVNNYFNDMVLSNLLSSDKFDKISFSYSNLMSDLGLNSISYYKFDGSVGKFDSENVDEYAKFDLTTSEGMATFKRIMEEYVYPKFKIGSIEKGEINQFFKQTDLVPDKEGNTTISPIIDMYNSDDPVLVSLIGEVITDFDTKVGKYYLVNTDGEYVDMKDLMWAYNLIVHKNKIGTTRLNRVFMNYVCNSDKNSLSYAYYKAYADYDNLENVLPFDKKELLWSMFSDGKSLNYKDFDGTNVSLYSLGKDFTFPMGKNNKVGFFNKLNDINSTTKDLNNTGTIVEFNCGE